MLVAAAGAAGCGSSGPAITQAPPPPPVNLTVYINDSRVSLSPDSVGAGPVVFIVTNQASSAQSLTLLPAGAAAGQPLASTGPISPDGTAQVKVEIDTRGDYTLTTAANPAGGSPSTSSVQPAMLYIGAPRRSERSDLLEP